MFEPVLETGDIIEINKKQYLVLGIFNYVIEDTIQNERQIFLNNVLKSVENLHIPEASVSSLIRNLYYYFLYYDSKTVKEFLTRVFAKTNNLLVCEYSSYPYSMKTKFLYNVKGEIRKVGKIKEEDVKLNLVKRAFTNMLFSKICTTTEVYNETFSDVKDSKITKKQKDFIKSYLITQLNLMTEQYSTAKKTLSYCIADIWIEHMHYLGYIRFTEDNVNVYAFCSKNASLKKKVELIFNNNELPKYHLDFRDVAKAEKVC